MKISKIIESILDEADKLSGQGMWSNTKMFPIQSKINLKDLRNGAMIHFTGSSSGAKGETWKKQGDTMICLYGDGVKGKKLSVSDMQKKLKSHGRIQLNAGKESIKEIRKGDYVNSMGEIGLVNKVKGQVAYVKFDSNPGSFHPMLASSLKKSGKHRGKDLYTESVNEGVPFPQDAPNEFAYLDYKKWAYKYRGQYKKDILKVKDSPGKIWATATKWWTEWAKRTGNKAYSNIKDSQKFGRELVKMMWKDNLIFDKSTHKITRLKGETFNAASVGKAPKGKWQDGPELGDA